jgi:hypothetical protein
LCLVLRCVVFASLSWIVSEISRTPARHIVSGRGMDCQEKNTVKRLAVKRACVKVFSGIVYSQSNDLEFSRLNDLGYAIGYR